jgi:neutral amino acid transport system permease protein
MQNLIFGLITGSILALSAVGFSMIRQTEGFINIAHGQMLTVGAFLGFILVHSANLNILVAGLVAMVIVGALGVILARLIFEPIAEKGALAQLFTSIGLAYLLYGGIRIVFGAKVQFYPNLFGRRFDLGPVNITVGELVIIGLAAASTAALHLFLTRTRLGSWIRATASNPELAVLRGIPVRRVSRAVWFIASALAGMAGVMLGVIGNVNSELGWTQILMVLAAAVLGGLGSIYGVLVAGLLLGLVMDLSALVIPSTWRLVVAFIVLVAVLVLRPQGLFSRAARTEAT